MGKLKQNNIQTYAKTKYYTSYGITLIALMITIIILLILAGVTLSLTLRRKRNI